MMGDQLDPTMSSQTSEMTKSQPKKAASRRTDIGQPDSNHSESSYSDTSHSDSTPRATSFASCLAGTSSTRPALTMASGLGADLPALVRENTPSYTSMGMHTITRLPA